MLSAREQRLSWNDSFMLQAIVSSWRSPDPNTQVGAVIVNSDNCIISTGYNGFPRGISVNALPWDRDKPDQLGNKYAYVVHAEKNALTNSTGSLKDCMLFVTLYPCNECAKDIIQAGIGRIVYLTNPYKDVWFTKAAKKMFQLVDIKVDQHSWSNPDLLQVNLAYIK